MHKHEEDELINRKYLLMLLITILMTSSMSGCIDEMEPHYILVIDLRVERGEISNGTILLPLPIKDDTIFYGIEGLIGAYDYFTVEITNTRFGKMLNISINNMNKDRHIYSAADYYQDKNINAKNPIDDEYLLTPKLNLTKRNEKVEEDFLIATYQSKIFIQYNSTDDTIFTLRYSIGGRNQDGMSRYEYNDRIDDIELYGPINEWLIINGSINR